MKNILVIGAHYDDSELGAGGTMAKMVSTGKNVFKITLTNTEVVSSNMNLNIKKETACANSKEACAILGVEELKIAQAQYGKLAYTLEMMKEIEGIIYEKNIDSVFMHYHEDYNTDHIAAHDICKTAARHCENIFMYQSNPYILIDGFVPNFFIDVSDFIDKKRAALMCYEEAHDRQGRLFETNISRNETWGYGNQVKYAEGFYVIKYKYE